MMCHNKFLDIIQRYDVLLYDCTSEALFVNDARRIMYCKGGKSIDSILLTTNALLQHIKQATIQGAFICSIAKPTIPDPTSLGWIRTNEILCPFWMSIPEAAKACYKFIHCGCKTQCCGQCKCFNANL